MVLDQESNQSFSFSTDIKRTPMSYLIIYMISSEIKAAFTESRDGFGSRKQSIIFIFYRYQT
ncbi:hypothetical protein CP988_17890, partial [Enterococcus faecium]